MATGKSKPTAAPVPTDVSFVVKCGSQGVFSSPSQAAAERKLSDLEAIASSVGSDQKYSLYERVVTYAPLPEDHPQYDAANPAKLPTGEASIGYPGTVKERKLS